jgi:hypothetical protein
MAINENIKSAVMRWVDKKRLPTEIFMSTATQHMLADELCRRIPENYHNPKHITMRGKAKAVDATEMARRVPTELTFGAVRVRVRIKDSIPTGSFILDFKRLVKQINYKNGQEEYVALDK